ncbi:Peroxidase 67 [Canna indica]|uniref:Peroxidase n=1 Tax=Canna indica TaxID=4628 RepID=A0AAQ3QP12_9LILI|nr:Peroxidase 67 [Canna indica]
MAASLIRLHFHDCFVQGCDASVLLKDSESIISEQQARQNNNSARGFEVIDIIKYAVEKACPAVVSCADILAVAARDSSILVRSHTIGNARCTTFRRRIHDETNIHPGFAKLRQHRCPSSQLIGNSTLAPLDAATPYSFDNHYFKNLLQRKGLLHSDQVLFNGGLTDHIVKRYSENEAAFFEDFAAAMVKMGDIKLLTGSAGEIRKLSGLNPLLLLLLLLDQIWLDPFFFFLARSGLTPLLLLLGQIWPDPFFFFSAISGLTPLLLLLGQIWPDSFFSARSGSTSSSRSDLA